MKFTTNKGNICVKYWEKKLILNFIIISKIKLDHFYTQTACW